MVARRKLKKLLPGLAVLGVIGASALASPALIAGAAVGYGYLGRLGGVLVGGPDASATGTAVSTFVVGTDYGIWYQTSADGTTWSGWAKIPGGIATSNLGATMSSTQTDVFVRGTDNAVWDGSLVGSAWTWSSWGGVATSDPDATSVAATRLDMVVRGTDNGLWYRNKIGTAALSNYVRIPNGIATSDAGVTSSTAGQIDVFTRGTDNQLWYISGNATLGWGTWAPLGGVLTSGPDAASCATGHMDVVVKGTNNAYWRRGTADGGTTWTAWQQLTTSTGNPGSWTSDPGVGCITGSQIYVFGRDTSNALSYFIEPGT